MVIVSMAPHPLIFGLLLIWYGFLAMFCLVVLRDVLWGDMELTFLLAAVAMAAVVALALIGWFFVWSGFWFEARKMRRILVELLSDPIAQLPSISEGQS
jgi:hypothetical protein